MSEMLDGRINRYYKSRMPMRTSFGDILKNVTNDELECDGLVRASKFEE